MTATPLKSNSNSNKKNWTPIIKLKSKIKVEIEIGIKNDNPKKISSISINLIESISNVDDKLFQNELIVMLII